MTTPPPSPDVPALPDLGSAPSWWQLQRPSAGWPALEHDLVVDACIVGAGVSGTSAAFHLAEAGLRVALLDAREVAGGASGRNGGFLLAGFALRHEALVARCGATRAADLRAWSCDVRDELLRTAAGLGLGKDARRTGSLRLAVDRGEVDDLDHEHELLRDAGFPVRRLTADQLDAPLRRAGFLGGLAFPDDGASQPAGWVRGLAAAATARGVAVHERTAVTELHSTGDGPVEVVTAAGPVVRCDHLVLCTEPHLGALAPELAAHVTPYRSQVLAARVTGDPALLTAPTWSRRGWDYAQRTPDGTFVVGGELVEDPARYATWSEATDPDDQAALEAWLAHLAGTAPTVVARWAGVIANNHDGFPYVGRLPGHERRWVCGGWGGAGNVLGFGGGRLVAAAITGMGSDDRTRTPPEFDPARVERDAA